MRANLPGADTSGPPGRRTLVPVDLQRLLSLEYALNVANKPPRPLQAGFRLGHYEVHAVASVSDTLIACW